MSYRTKLSACAICGRKFQIARLKDHEDICRRVTENAKRRGVFNATRQRKVKGFKVKNRAKKTRRATMEYDKQRRAREKEKRRLRNARKAQKIAANDGYELFLILPTKALPSDWVPKCSECLNVKLQDIRRRL